MKEALSEDFHYECYSLKPLILFGANGGMLLGSSNGADRHQSIVVDPLD
jgi:hypothetical protein